MLLIVIIISPETIKNLKNGVKISGKNIFWYGRSAKMAKTPIQKPVCFFGQKWAKFGNLGN